MNFIVECKLVTQNQNGKVGNLPFSKNIKVWENVDFGNRGRVLKIVSILFSSTVFNGKIDPDTLRFGSVFL